MGKKRKVSFARTPPITKRRKSMYSRSFKELCPEYVFWEMRMSPTSVLERDETEREERNKQEESKQHMIQTHRPNEIMMEKGKPKIPKEREREAERTNYLQVQRQS